MNTGTHSGKSTQKGLALESLEALIEYFLDSVADTPEEDVDEDIQNLILDLQRIKSILR